jgi:hypothetical protein
MRADSDHVRVDLSAEGGFDLVRDSGRSRQSTSKPLLDCGSAPHPGDDVTELLEPFSSNCRRAGDANPVLRTDLTCLSVSQCAIDVLRLGHVVVDHSGCGGVA